MKIKRSLEKIVLAGIVLSIFNAAFSAEQFGLTDEQFSVLKEAFAEYEKASDNFITLNRRACMENPELAAVQVCLLRDEHLRNNYPGQKEFEKFIKYSNETIDRKELFDKCRFVFDSKAALNIFKDPNWATEIKPALLAGFWFNYNREIFPEAENEFKKILKENNLTVFDPNDPNDEILWANIQNYHKELDQYYLSKQQELLEDYNMPAEAALYPGTYNLYQGIFEFSTGILRMETPKEVVKAAYEYEKKGKELYQKKREMNIEQPLMALMPFLSSKNMQIDPQKMQGLTQDDIWPALRKYLDGTNDYVFEDEALHNLATLNMIKRLTYIIRGECQL